MLLLKLSKRFDSCSVELREARAAIVADRDAGHTNFNADTEFEKPASRRRTERERPFQGAPFRWPEFRIGSTREDHDLRER